MPDSDINDTDMTAAELAGLLAATGATIDPDGVDDTTTFDSVGVDSLGLLGVITAIERGRGVALPDDAQQIETLTVFLAVVNDSLRKVAL
ncbi:acyl carrier protein [Actinophytocola xinjiangensis]|uniref:acyl carrier protein n=1 Tax=Actinophytocola xinjiangensis TaxID=485602 RepID=UPI000A6005FB|nr:acyl carrier protein [Actinophytocola xinjiangensis]